MKISDLVPVVVTSNFIHWSCAPDSNSTGAGAGAELENNKNGWYLQSNKQREKNKQEI